MIDLFEKIPEMLFGAALAVPVTHGTTRVWQHFKHRIHARTIHQLFAFTAEPTHIFLPMNSPSDGGFASGYGDLLALTELIGITEKLHGRRSQISVHPGKDHALAQFKEHHLISIGGYRHNSVYSTLINHLNPPLHFWHETKFRSREIQNKDGTINFQPRSDRKGNVVSDVGIALRAPNPFNPEKTVLIVAGAHTYGSIAAMKYFCDPSKAREFPSRKGERAVVVVSCEVDTHRISAVRRISNITQW